MNKRSLASDVASVPGVLMCGMYAGHALIPNDGLAAWVGVAGFISIGASHLLLICGPKGDEHLQQRACSHDDHVEVQR